jgi:hypothetical protein
MMSGRHCPAATLALRLRGRAAATAARRGAGRVIQPAAAGPRRTQSNVTHFVTACAVWTTCYRFGVRDVSVIEGCGPSRKLGAGTRGMMKSPSP